MKKVLSLVVILILVLCVAAFAESTAYEESVISISTADYDSVARKTDALILIDISKEILIHK